MKIYFLIVLMFSLLSCEDTSDSSVSEKLGDSFAQNDKPEDYQVGEQSYTDYHKISEENISRKLDILVVPDTSSSIKEERESIAQGFHHFLNSMPQGIDTNIGVLLAHGPKSNIVGKLYKKNHDPYVLKTSELTIEQIKDYLSLKIHKPKEDGSSDGGEMGMYAILEALKPENLLLMKAQGLFREDAALAIVFIADEQDICAKFPDGVTPVVDQQNGERKMFVDYCIEEDIRWQDVNIGSSEYTYKITPNLVYNKLLETNPGTRMVIGGVIYDTGSVIPTGNEDEIGYGYKEIIELADGVSIDLASGNYGEGLAKIGRLAGVKEGEVQHEFAVKTEFTDPDSIKVYLDDNLYTDWTFDKETQTITLGDQRDLLSIIKFEYSNDTIKPVISQIDPFSGLTKNPNLTFTFSVGDDYLDTVEIYNNDEVVATYNTMIVNADINLVEGENHLLIVAKDKAGNISTRDLGSIELDTTPPVLSNIQPANDSTVFSLNFNLSASSNEILSKIVVENNEIELNSSSFSLPYAKESEGNHSIDIIAFDTAGNSSTTTINFDIVLKLIRIELVNATAVGEQVKIMGGAGSAKAGLEVEISGGFFDTKTVIVEADGSFEAFMNFSTSYSLSADDSSLNLSENYSLNFEVDTTLSGVVKDINDMPIPGVIVTIEKSGQSVLTDGNGVFEIANPATGDQKIIIDATQVPESYTMGLKKYSSSAINVSLGNLERNVLDRVIYLAPILLDGTETEVVANQALTVTSIHAPGVSIDIPSNTVVFPDNVEPKMNILEIPSDKVSIELLDESKPDTVYALEPSGVKFTEPVKLSLPNPNGFTEGTELVIMSKNSETGFWEPDGTATVSASGMIETKEDQGISHFSEVYATPYGLELKEYAPSDNPGIYNDKGGVAKTITLPSYKTMGSEIAPKLFYNSQWANPNVLVTNTINTPSTYIYKKDWFTGGSAFGSGKVSVKTKTWQKPEYLKSQFTTASEQTPWLFFDVTKPPDKSTISYAVDLNDVTTGSYPAEALYVLRYRYISIQRIKSKTRDALGQTSTKKKTKRIDKLLDEVFPPALRTNLLLQNRIESEVGSGWKLGLNQKLVNTSGGKITIEEESGQLTPYVIKNSVETVATEVPEDSHMSLNGDDFVLVSENQIYDLDGNTLVLIDEIPKDDIIAGVNLYDYIAHTSDGRKHDCWWGRYRGKRDVFPISIKKNSSSQYLFVDTYGQIMSYAGGSTNWIAARRGEPQFRQNGYAGGGLIKMSDVQNMCKTKTGNECGETLYEYHKQLFTDGYKNPESRCLSKYGDRRQYGENIPTSAGFENSTLRDSRFNQPKDIITLDGSTYLVADYGNNVIRRLNVSSDEVTNFAGNRKTQETPEGGQAEEIAIYHPTAMVQDRLGNIYIASERGYIRKVDKDGKIEVIAGLPVNQGGLFVDSTDEMLKMSFSNPQGLVVDDDNGYLYVADTDNHRIVQLDLVEGDAETVIGTSICNSNDIEDGKSGLNVSICYPKNIGVDSDYNLVFLDSENKIIRKINLNSSDEDIQRFVPQNTNDTSELIRLADGSFERVYRNGTMAKFNAQGFHLFTQDLIGNQVNFSYSSGKLVQMIDSTGGPTYISYSGDKVSNITDPAGKSTQFIYDGNLLSEVNYPDNTSERFYYNEKGMLTSEIGKRGFETRYEYNEMDRLAKVIKPDTNTIEFNDGLAETFSSGNYDENNKKEISGDEESELADIYKDARGIETKLNKDESGLVTSITDSKERVTTIERDLKSRPIKITRFDNTYTVFEYNELGDLAYKFDSNSGEEENFEYNDLGNLTKYTNPRAKIKQNFYDPATGLLTQETDFNGNSIYRDYYSDGLVKTIENDKAEITQFFYDNYGNLESKVSPEGEVTSYIRDSAGNIIEKTNAKGISTFYTYDNFNRLTSVSTGITNVDPIGIMTSYFYDEAGNLTKIIDPKNNATFFDYDELNRLAKKTTSLGQITELAYDGNGNVIWEKDPNGAVKTFEYDTDNLLTKKSLPDNLYTMEYDDHGNLTLVADDDSAISFDYEKIGKEFYVASTTSEGSNLKTNTLEYTYDIIGNRKSMLSDFGDFSYNYDNGNRLISLTNHKNETFGFDYDEANRLSKIIRPNTQTEFNFDKNSFVTSISHKKSSTILNQYVYTRDAIGNRESVTNSRGIASYGYDAESQLTAVTNTEVSGDYATEGFNYDNLGNRLNDQLGSYVYDNKSQRLTQDYKHLYYYDNNGNLTSVVELGMTGNFKNLHYSSENQLIKIETFESNNKIKEVDYFYDALGRRSRKVVQDLQNAANNDERQYVYDGQEILAELDGSDNTLAVFTHSTLRTDDTLAVDVKDTRIANSTGTYYYFKDALGSIVDIANSAGSIVQHYAYSSFGKILKITDGNGNDITNNAAVKTSYGFTNREHDSESGMMYYRARYMMPEIGRFISEDTDPGLLDLPSTVNNRYIYGLNNPVRFVDPSGEFIIEAMIIGAIIGGIDAHMNGKNILEGIGRGALTGLAIATFYQWSPILFGSTKAFWITMGTSAFKASITDNGQSFTDNFINISGQSSVLALGGGFALGYLEFGVDAAQTAVIIGEIAPVVSAGLLYDYTCHNKDDESRVVCEEIIL